MDEFNDIYGLIRAEKYDEALALLLCSKGKTIACHFKSDSNHAWYVVGDILFKKGLYKEAIAAFRKSLRNRLDDYQASWAIGESYSLLGRPRIAERYFRQALLQAKSESDKSSLIYNLGNALFDQRKYEDAINAYKNVSQKNKTIFKLASKNALTALSKLQRRKTLSGNKGKTK